jgi:predicted ATPase/DNA-binding SARP family transcriptional activator
MMRMNVPVRIEMLGGLRVLHGDRVISRFQTQKTAALLAYLAIQPGQSFAREAVGELLWPGADPVAVRNRLNQAVSSLRRQLHPPGSDRAFVIQAGHHSLALSEPSVRTDMTEFQELVEGSLADQARAVTLYRGELLSGLNEEWILPLRSLLHDRCMAALDQLTKSAALERRWLLALEFNARMIGLGAGSTEVHARQMELFVRAGRPSSALRHYQHLANHLQGEAFQEIEKWRHQASQMMAGSAGASIEAAPHAAVTIEVPSGRRQTPNLPRSLSTFYGREEELERARALISSGTRIVTFAGLGGAGKTRLAIEAAWNLLPLFENATFIACEDMADASDLTGAAAIALGDSDSKRMLLVLDQLEHLVDAGLYELRSFLESHANVQCLVTSRQILGVAGEVPVTLGPLPVPAEDKTQSLSEISENPSIALFLSRAQAARQDFQLTDRSVGTIVALVRCLEGIPLALELAAAWARTLTPSQMLDRVQRLADRLESRRRDILPRHRSMRAAIEGSFEILPPECSRVLTRLSAFRGGWTVEAANHLCPGVAIDEALQTLVERSFISVTSENGESRFSMLETIRSFASACLTRDEAVDCRWLHAEYFRDRINTLMRRSAQPPFAELHQDHANLLAALDWFVNLERWESGVDLAVGLTRLWKLHGRIREGIERLERIAWFAEDSDLASRDRARLQACLGELYHLQGRSEEGKSALQDALDLFQEAEDPFSLIETKFALQQIHHNAGDFPSAESLLHEILPMAEEQGRLDALARCWLRLGNIAVELGQNDEARHRYETSLKVARSVGELERVAAALTNLGNLALQVGDPDLALNWLNEALQIYKDLNFWPGARSALLNVAAAQHRKGLFEEAAQSLLEVLASGLEEGRLVIDLLNLAGSVLLDLGEPRRAIEAFAGAEAIGNSLQLNSRGIERTKFEEPRARARDLVGGQVHDDHWLLGQSMTAEESLARAETVLKELTYNPLTRRCTQGEPKG